jgi:hypothetical protein
MAADPLTRDGQLKAISGSIRLGDLDHGRTDVCVAEFQTTRFCRRRSIQLSCLMAQASRRFPIRLAPINGSVFINAMAEDYVRRHGQAIL